MKTLEYRWKLLELKRYFIMASLLKQLPMFSEEVDELWHEMLMLRNPTLTFVQNLWVPPYTMNRQLPAKKRQEHEPGLTGCIVNYLSSLPIVP